MDEQAQAPHHMTETEAQALAWRLQSKLPLGWGIETVAHDPHAGPGWFVELRNDQRPYVVRVFKEEDVAHFYHLHGPQHPVEFDTDSFILTFHPEQVRMEFPDARAGQVALKDVIELIEWGTPHLAFLKALDAKRVRCPTCGRSDGKLLWVERTTGRYVWQCWDEHWFTTTYDYEQAEMLPGEPEPENSDLPF